MDTEISEREFKQMLKKERIQELTELLTTEKEYCHWCGELFLLGQKKWSAKNPENTEEKIKLCKPCFLYLLHGTHEEPIPSAPIVSVRRIDMPAY